MDLTRTLTDRTFRINSTFSGFHYGILNLKLVLQKNEFLFDKSINNTLVIMFSNKKNMKKCRC